MRQIAHLGYAILLKDRTKVQIAELEVLLTEPEKKGEMIDRQNAEAMSALGGFGLIPAPKRATPKPRPRGEG